MAVYTTIDNPGEHFAVKTFTGSASEQVITGIGFESDLTMIKARDATHAGPIFFKPVNSGLDHLYYALTDQNQGASKMTSYSSDGYTLPNSNEVNQDGVTYVSWNWKANGTGSSNTDGSINTTATSANTTAGFSISTYTSTEANATLGHGLGAAPEFIWIHGNSNAGEWVAYHKGMASDPETDYITTHSAGIVYDDATVWQDTAPSSSIVTIGTYTDINYTAGRTYIMCCWKGIQGFSKFGNYPGTGNADGAFVYTGFKPAFVITKARDVADNWWIFDNKREGYNADNAALYGNQHNAEADPGWIDLLSNGFKMRNNDVAGNGSGNEYIYMAFAEAPFVNSNGVPCNAR